MDTNLPSLDIVEDIEEVMNDEPTPEKIQSTIDEVEKLDENEDSPFVPKVTETKKKKELSEKQKAHLEKIRKLALEKKKEKQRAKKEALEKVDQEHKPRSYKPRKKKTEEDKKYKEKTLKVEIKEPREQPENNPKNSTPEDFVPSHKENIEKDKKYKEEQDKLSFMNFMGNMEKYMLLKDDYDRKKNSSRNVQTHNNPPSSKPQQKPTQKPKQPIPVPLKPVEKINPYSNYFG